MENIVERGRRGVGEFIFIYIFLFSFAASRFRYVPDTCRCRSCQTGSSGAFYIMNYTAYVYLRYLPKISIKLLFSRDKLFEDFVRNLTLKRDTSRAKHLGITKLYLLTACTKYYNNIMMSASPI